MVETVLFKNISHIRKVHRGERNEDIMKIPKGEEYDVMFNKEYPEDDVKYERWIDRWRYKWNITIKCVAKEDRWRSGADVLRTIEDVVNDWGGRIYYNQDDGFFYFRSFIEVHMLDGEKYKTYFDTYEEMDEHLESVYKASEMKGFIVS